MKIRTIYNRLLPWGDFVALTVYPFIFVRKDQRGKYTSTAFRHEKTHALQQRELLLLPFLVLYGLEWIVKMPLCRFDRHRAYRSISFEQEAYATQREIDYNMIRSSYAWRKYVFTLKKK